MYKFLDYFGNEVELVLGNNEKELFAKHVFVICKFHDMWLLTKHKKRGLEFPGGKVEKNESPIDAARREVKEETGALVSNLEYIGQYTVLGEENIVKNIYYAAIKKMSREDTYFETDGPQLVKELPTDLVENEHFSFIMKDDVLVLAMEYIKNSEC